jgi:hypothetical protein
MHWGTQHLQRACRGHVGYSKQAGAGQGARRSSGRRLRYILKGGRMDLMAGTKPYKSAIAEIAQGTFNTGHNKFAAQFTQLRKNIATNFNAHW